MLVLQLHRNSREDAADATVSPDVPYASGKIRIHLLLGIAKMSQHMAYCQLLAGMRM